MGKTKQKTSKQKKSKQPTTDDNYKIINFYELDAVKKFKINYINPCYNYEKMPLKHPMRMVICGASGSGKSNLLLNIIRLMDETFEKILIFTQNKKEQLYKYLESALDSDSFQIYEGIQSVHNYNFDNCEEKQHLIIFDDMCTQSKKKQEPISELFIRGRKMADEYGFSLIYLTQSYYQVPIDIRKQLSSLILVKINGKRDPRSILADCSTDATTQQLLRAYNYCCNPDDIKTFLFIDISAPERDRFRSQFDTIIDIGDF